MASSTLHSSIHSSALQPSARSAKISDASDSSDKKPEASAKHAPLNTKTLMEGIQAHPFCLVAIPAVTGAVLGGALGYMFGAPRIKQASPSRREIQTRQTLYREDVQENGKILVTRQGNKNHPDYSLHKGSQNSKEASHLSFSVAGPSEAHAPLQLRYQGNHLENAILAHPETGQIEGITHTLGNPPRVYSVVHNGQVLDSTHDTFTHKHGFGFVDLGSQHVDKRIDLNANPLPPESEFIRRVYFDTKEGMKAYLIFPSLQAFQHHARLSYALVGGVVSALIGLGVGVGLRQKKRHEPSAIQEKGASHA